MKNPLKWLFVQKKKIHEKIQNKLLIITKKQNIANNNTTTKNQI